MVSIAQDDVGAGRPHFGGAHRLYRCGSAHGHKGRGANVAALHFYGAGAGLSIGGGNLKVESADHAASHSVVLCYCNYYRSTIE